MSRRVERCGPSGTDWMRSAPPQPELERFEAYIAGPGYDIHRHDTYALGYIIRGATSLYYRGARSRGVQGNVTALYPDERHDGRAASTDGFLYRTLYLEPRVIRDAIGERTRSLPFVKHPVLRSARLLRVLRSGLEDLERCLEPLAVDRLVVTIAEALLDLDESPNRIPNRRLDAPMVERARQFLDANYHRVVQSEELEVATGIDRYSLARHFRRRLGTSPYRYLMMRRLDHARSMMRAGRSLGDIAYTCGFADQSHLTRQFKQAYGLSPGHWRSLQA